MSKILKGLTYSYNRNIGWQDRIIRTFVGILAIAGAIYFYPSNFAFFSILAGVVLAQIITVFSARCMICYFMDRCTITGAEKESLRAKGVLYED
jgi:hypothetical protein